MSNHKELSEAHFHDLQKSYPYDLFTPQEKKLIQFFNGRSLYWTSGWINGAANPCDEVDSEIWGLEHVVMKTLALRVMRHKTGAMPIPELEKPPLPRPDPIQARLKACVKTVCNDLQAAENGIKKAWVSLNILSDLVNDI